MLNQKFFQKLRDNYNQADTARRDIQKASGDALHQAKRAIFELHRGDLAGGEELLKTSSQELAKVAKIKDADNEGIYRAALEEYAEAELFWQFVKNENIGDIKGAAIDEETYLGALTDTVGEILRFAIKQATERRWAELERAQKAVDEIMAALIELNFTGYLRNKYDQAKNSRRKLEEIIYEVSLRK